MNCQETDKQENAALSPMDMLHRIYKKQPPVVNSCITREYQALEELLRSLPDADREDINQTVFAICSERERHAFAEGVRTGYRLAEELHAK